INTWMKEHEMNIDQLVCLGYSNGANMMIATIFYYPELIKNVILLRPMLPFTPQEQINLEDHTLLVHYAPNDEMVSEQDSIKLIELLRSYKAEVTFQTYSTGHQLSSEEIDNCIQFLT
ncbi:MAG TPA: dienelactone hydrolase family protein, partial [Candidatus Woesebacteria bacterium]|nr:dienelactone hydrolase family protein [Candidatus Woesebacteria bacterium]